MTKEEFAAQLRHRLEHMPEAETDKSVEFYLELIDDRMEEGADEAEAVAALGSLDEITANIVAELPLAAAVRERRGSAGRAAASRGLCSRCWARRFPRHCCWRRWRLPRRGSSA